MSGELDVASCKFESGSLVGTCDLIDAMKLAEMTQAAYGRDVKVLGDSKADTDHFFLKNFNIFGSDEDPNVPGSAKLSSRLENAVDQIEIACNGYDSFGVTGIGTNEAKLWSAIAPLTAEEFALVNERFAHKHGYRYSTFGGKWDIGSELKDELNSEELARFNKMIADKSVNDVPSQFRTNGELLLKPYSQLEVGKMNRVTLSDGREYDVYVPKNADNRAPLVVATGGAELKDIKDVMSAEAGLTIEAEKTGSIMVFGYLHEKTDKSYSDNRYMDNVLRDVRTRTQAAEKVGMIGFSDATRFAEEYAANNPNKVAGIVSVSATWKEGDTFRSAVPTMLPEGNDVLNKPDMRHNFVSRSVGFLKQQIVKGANRR